MKTSQEDAHTIKALLEWFGGASGLRCNMEKSSLSLVWNQGVVLEEIDAVLGCKINPMPIQYLGLPLSFRKARKEDFRHLL